MSETLWTRLLKIQADKDSTDHAISEKQPVREEVTPAVDVSPGGLSFEEGAALHSSLPVSTVSIQ